MENWKDNLNIMTIYQNNHQSVLKNWTCEFHFVSV